MSFCLENPSQTLWVKGSPTYSPPAWHLPYAALIYFFHCPHIPTGMQELELYVVHFCNPNTSQSTQQTKPVLHKYIWMNKQVRQA